MSRPGEGDRPVVPGSSADGPIEPGGAGAGPEVAQDYSVAGTADPGASHADPDAGRMAGEDAPKAPNQAKTEPMPPSPEHDDVPAPAGGDLDEDPGTSSGPGPREGWATAPPSSEGAGDANGVPVPSDTAAEGTSEGVAPVEGVTFPAIAPESLADGETDVAMPSTTSF